MSAMPQTNAHVEKARNIATKDAKCASKKTTRIVPEAAAVP
jgi:hypothetical protein